MAKGGDAATGLLPDLPSEMVAVPGHDVGVVELVRRVVAGLGGEYSRTLNHVVDVLRGHSWPARDRWNDIEIGSESANQREALVREAVRHHDRAAVALGAADHGQRRTR